MWPCASAKAAGDPIAASLVESLTMRRTPAAAAASIAAVSKVAWAGWLPHAR